MCVCCVGLWGCGGDGEEGDVARGGFPLNKASGQWARLECLGKAQILRWRLEGPFFYFCCKGDGREARFGEGSGELPILGLSVIARSERGACG